MRGNHGVRRSLLRIPSLLYPNSGTAPMTRSLRPALLACAIGSMACLHAADAFAQDSEFTASFDAQGESPRDFELELNGTFYTPDLDGEAGLSGTPYADIFGKGRMWVFEAELDYEIVDLGGPLGVGFSAGFGWVTGKGVYADSGEESPDETTLRTFPMRLMAVYRFQLLDRKGIPLIPFVKAGLGYTFWWSEGGDGKVSKSDGMKARGGKWGYNLGVGLALSLNFIDRPLARDCDRLWGINDTHVMVQFMHATADNFGGDGFDFTRDSLMVGLGFEF